MNPLVSIVMTAYNRAPLLKNTLASIERQTYKNLQVIVVEDGQSLDGATEEVCAESVVPVEYYCRVNRPRIAYSNPAIPKNIGIKKAQGDILIIQCAEVMYTKNTDIAELVRPLTERRQVSNFALCESLSKDGLFVGWYAHPTKRGTNWFLDFCQAAHLADVKEIGGFDEEYEGYGFDDDDFALRMQASGVTYQWANDVVTQHQWHTIPDKKVELSEAGRARYERVKWELSQGRPRTIANEGRDWGNINS